MDPRSSIVDRANLYDEWYNIDNKEGNMNKYQVHYSKGTPKGLKHGKRTIAARNEQEAKAKVSFMVPGSFSHWVNRLANEAV